MPKCVLFFVTNTTQPFDHLSTTDFDRYKNVNLCRHAYTSKKILKFCAGGFYRSPKQLKIGTSEGVCDKTTSQTAQFRALGIVLWPSRHPKEVPFVSEFWWGMYGLGAISPRKQPISAKANLQNYKFQRHSPGGDTYYVPCCALCY